MKITLTRHGYTNGNLQKKYIGVTDETLSLEWLETQEIKADDKVETVYISKKIRTRQTAEILFPLAKQIQIAQFNEMDFGDFENKSYEELKEDIRYKKWLTQNCESECPNGENKKDFINRVRNGFLNVVNEVNNEEIFMVVHGGTIMAICDQFAMPKYKYFNWKIDCLESLVFEWNGRNLEEIK